MTLLISSKILPGEFFTDQYSHFHGFDDSRENDDDGEGRQKEKHGDRRRKRPILCNADMRVHHYGNKPFSRVPPDQEGNDEGGDDRGVNDDGTGKNPRNTEGQDNIFKDSG